jgi:hypothetical protein
VQKCIELLLNGKCAPELRQFMWITHRSIATGKCVEMVRTFVASFANKPHIDRLPPVIGIRFDNAVFQGGADGQKSEIHFRKVLYKKE